MDGRPIISVTPNPALDLGGTVARLVPDEKNYVHAETRFPGGNAINAARIIHRLSGDVEVSGFLGGGIGAELSRLLDSEGIRHQFIPIGGSTRISVTVSNASTHHQTRLSFSGPTISAAEYRELLDYLERTPAGALVLIGGSLPPGVRPECLREMIEVLHRNHSECILDVPGVVMRQAGLAPFWPLLIKPNLSEFREMIGKEISNFSEVLVEAKDLTSKIPLVCVSSVNGGALLASPQGSWFGRIPKVEIRTTVGAGDSMVGAMAARVSQWRFSDRNGSELASCIHNEGAVLLRWALAAACATLSVHGTQLGSADQIQEYLPKIEVQEL